MILFRPLILSIPMLVLVSTSLSHADIVGGDEVSERDSIARSTVALYGPSRSGQGGALCTASLISNDSAVTAAHCIDPGGINPVLIFGKDVRSSTSEKRRVSAVAVNPRWKTHQGRGMDQGDIAVVKFPGGLPVGYKPVPILGSDAQVREGQKAVLAGYGISDARRKTGAGKLRKTNVEIEKVRRGKSEMILDQSHGHGACHGDSGGPAFVRLHGHPVLMGVTNRSYPSRGPDDCAHRVVYTKVSSYRPWIARAEAGMKSDPREFREKATPSGISRTMLSIRRKAARRIQRHVIRGSHVPRRRRTHPTRPETSQNR